MRSFNPRAHPLLAVSLLLGLSAPALAQDYPRLGLYGRVWGTGYPFIQGGTTDGPLDVAVLDSVARFHEVILTASPITEYRPDVNSALRLRNPGITILAYVMACYIWDGVNAPDSTVNFATRYRRLVRDMNGYLYNRAGGTYTDYNVNLAKRDATGRFVMAEALADLFYDAVVREGYWDGIFLDVFGNSLLWSQTPAESIDFQRAGYSTLADFDLAWKAGTDTLASRLRRLSGSAFVLVGNGGQGTKYVWCNGWMRENFPLQNGGTWYENMYRDPGGYFTDEWSFRAPRHNYLFSWAETPATPYTLASARKVRFGLGSAALGDGFDVYGPHDLDSRTYAYHNWWFDEYAVDLATGRSSPSRAHTGWLGQPLGPTYQMVWAGSGPDASTNPDFETDVTSGWTFFSSVPATVSRDATNAAVGNASAHLKVVSPGPYDWYTSFSTVNRLDVVAGQPYSATFWARASAPRKLGINAGNPGGGVAYRSVPITTSWQRYQVVLTPSSSATVSLMIFVGDLAGDVWLDDVHFQAGATSIYRRDFQNGTVLVNPSSLALSVPLERPFRKLLGLVDPIVNDGSEVSQIALPSSDALFLIGRDIIPPSPVGDMLVVPR